MRTRPSSLLHSVFIAPFGRLDAAWADVMGVIGAIVAHFAGAPFQSTLLLLLVLSIWDHRLGRAVAKAGQAGKVFDPIVSQNGFISKMSGVGYALAIRWLESILHAEGLWDRSGMLAFGFALVLVVREFESVDRNRELLRGSATPILRPVLSFFRSIADRLIPVPTEDRPK